MSATFNNTSQQMTVYRLLNSNGVKIFSSNKKSLWPVWLSIANLPPIKRCMFKNIFFANLWFGKGKPSWDMVFQVNLQFFQCHKQSDDRYKEICFLNMRHEMEEGFTVKIKDKDWKLELRVVLFNSDLPAKSSILNMQQFNGYFGCTLCIVECCRGEDTTDRNGKRHQGPLFYPDRKFTMRTPQHYNNYAGHVARNKLSLYKGVKGKTAIAKFIPHIPLSTPIDFMHQVLLGVGRTLLHIVKTSLGKSVGN